MSITQKFLIIVVLVLGLGLRLHNYEKYPQRGATSDEYTYSFLGLSLLTKGYPSSWSHFGAYKDREDLTIDGIYFPIVKPYFDHPPLFGLLVASIALFNGEHSFAQIKLSTIRLVPIAFSVLSSIFLFLVALKLTDYHSALWATIIYSTVTIYVIQSRVVLAENLLTPIFLGAIWTYQRFKHHVTMKRAVLLGLLSTAAIWTKEIGVTLAASLIVMFVRDKVAKKIMLLYIGIVLLGVSGYMLYGAVYDWETFVNIITLQGTRDVGPGTLWYVLTTPLIINKVYYDGWYYFGFFALALLLQTPKQYMSILVPSLLYFLFLLFSLTQKGELGWYMIPLYPFFSIASAIALRRSIKKHDGTHGVFALLVGFVFMQSIFGAYFGLTALQFRILFLLLTAPWIVSLFFYKHRFSGAISRAYFYLFILLSAYSTYTYVHPV